VTEHQNKEEDFNMKKIIEKIVAAWKAFLVLCIQKWFVLSYPLIVLTVVAIAAKSILVGLTLVIWFIAVIANIDDDPRLS
jgi:hypothetical protein